MENVPLKYITGVGRAADNTLLFILYYAFKIIPMLVGAMSIYLGYRLFILGVTGQASLSLNAHSVSGQLINAAPGLFFAVGGTVANVAAVWKGVQISFQKDSPYIKTMMQRFTKEPAGGGESPLV